MAADTECMFPLTVRAESCTARARLAVPEEFSDRPRDVSPSSCDAAESDPVAETISASISRLPATIAFSESARCPMASRAG
ncbi:hypothetical protein DSECCO2_622120 [anaerobic digester metagenome]